MDYNKKPFARCSKCGRYTDNEALINESCTIKFVKRGKCKGVYKSMLLDSDWKECKSCLSGGMIDNNCSVCQGTGWVCTRNN